MTLLGNPLVYDLLALAQELSIGGGAGSARNVFRRRAISTAYYGAFQAVCFVFADQLIGWESDERLLRPVFRLIDHRDLDRVSRHANASLRTLGDALTRLRERRSEADYLPPAFEPTEAHTTESVQLAREVVGMVEALSNDDRRELAVLLLTKRR